jgi:hypothetical protein
MQRHEVDQNSVRVTTLTMTIIFVCVLAVEISSSTVFAAPSSVIATTGKVPQCVRLRIVTDS